MVKIKDLPLLERPRERLIYNGIDKLSNEELLAIILKTGGKGQSSKMLAVNILSYIKDISNLKNITLKELTNIKGIGKAKACDILATIELGKRLNSGNTVIKHIKFNSPDIIFNYYKDKLKDKKQECFYAVYLDASKKVIEDKLLFIGTVNQSIVHPRNIFKEACILDSSSIICIHNHPSDNVLPSKEDINLTKNLIEIGKIFSIPVIDHIIVGPTKYYSFFENGDI
jgi:DNA repair protein RadC